MTTYTFNLITQPYQSISKIFAKKLNFILQINHFEHKNLIMYLFYLLFLESDTNETQKLRQDLDEVRMSILNLECNTNRKNEEINIDLNEWQVHKAKLEEIRPWLENAEKKINTDHIKPITLQMANDWLKNTQV